MKNKEKFLNKIIDDLPIAEYRSQMTKDEWKGWFEDAYNEGYKQAKALQLLQTGVSGCFSYKEALEFLQLHTPIAVKPIKKSKYKFVQPFTSKNARDIVIFSLATELSKNNR